MGFVKGVGFDVMPKQGAWINRRTEVCFNYDSSKSIMGTIVRDDLVEPYMGIIALDDGRFVLTTECMHSPIMPPREASNGH